MSHTHTDTPDTPEESFSPLQRVKRRFFAMRNGMLADQMRRGGLNYRVNFGLNLPQLKDIAAEIATGWGLNSGEIVDLADTLWDNVNTRESRLLAPLLVGPVLRGATVGVQEGSQDLKGNESVDQQVRVAALAESWMPQAQTVEVADILCHSLLRFHPQALALAAASLMPKENADGANGLGKAAPDMERYTAMRLLVNLLSSGKAAAEEVRPLLNAEYARKCQLTLPLYRRLEEEIIFFEQDRH